MEDDTHSVLSNGTELTEFTSVSQQKPGKPGHPVKRSVSRSSSRASVRSKSSKAPQPTKLETKEDLEKHVRQWIQLDNEIRKLQALSRERRDMKKQITQDLVNVMKENDIDFNVSDGKLVYKESKRKSPLNEKHISACLMELFGNNPHKAQEIMEFIASKRETKTVDTVQRRIHKGAKETILKSGHETIKQALLQE